MNTPTLLKFIVATFIFATASTSASLLKIDQASLYGDAIVTDFESFNLGSVSSDIFNAGGISNIDLLGSLMPSQGTEKIQVGDNGNALSSVNGELSIVNRSHGIDYFLNNAGFTISLVNEAAQFGFQIVDEFNVDFLVRTFSSDTLLDTTVYRRRATDPAVVYFESNTTFDRVEITLSSLFAGFAIDNITFADISSTNTTPTDIPEPITAVLLLIGLLSLGLTRQKEMPIKP
ncbi:hypothetical protein OE749_02015 [Aestuariibacter sp. AA17]|uniref:PEP-CTERM protein-sorting domain-containing protein n=1 Tax=Fluctibacter corallii TaxID=2984329 RepID=A0ABT3A4F1_9ALTE|nr:hypothetical protein [Aestuariibacter sp. AA17]MCV2883472.1 hypothetical protein [Aestuariibacter sp. AA17]